MKRVGEGFTNELGLIVYQQRPVYLRVEFSLFVMPEI